MASFQLSPSVDVREIDLTNIVPAVSTSIGALAGAFAWGPVEQIVTIAGEKDLIDVYGKPQIPTSSGSIVSNFTNQADWYAAANFLSYSSAIKIVRADSEDLLNASDLITLVGEYKTKQTFTPATPSDDRYIIDFGETNVSDTLVLGQSEKVISTFTFEGAAALNDEVNVPEVSATAATYESTVTGAFNDPTPGDQLTGITALAQTEVITVVTQPTINGFLNITVPGQTAVSVAITATPEVDKDTTNDVATAIAAALTGALGINTATALGDVVTVLRAANETVSSVGVSGTVGIDTQGAAIGMTMTQTDLVPTDANAEILTVPSISVSNTVTAPGAIADTVNGHIFSSPTTAGLTNTLNKGYWLVVNNTSTNDQYASQLALIIGGSSGLGSNATGIANVVGWTNETPGANPPSLGATLPEPAITPATATFSVTTQELSAGSNSIPAETYPIVLSSGSSNSEVIVAGGDILSTVVTKIVAHLNNTVTGQPLEYSAGQNWIVEQGNLANNGGTDDQIIFTAPVPLTGDVAIQVDIGVGQTNANEASGIVNVTAITANGLSPGQGVITVNGIDIVVLDTQTPLQVALSWEVGVAAAVTAGGEGPQDIVNNEDGTLEVFAPTGVGITVAPMLVVGSSTNPPQQISEYGMSINSYIAADDDTASWTLSNNVFVTPGNVTAWTDLQVPAMGVNITIEGSDVIRNPTSGLVIASTPATITFPVSQISTVPLGTTPETWNTEVTLVGDLLNFEVGVPLIAGEEFVEPAPVPGTVLKAGSHSKVKNSEDFNTQKLALAGGYFYAIYPGLRGDSIGIGFADACLSETAYNDSYFANGSIKFKDVFDSRPSTSTWDTTLASGWYDELNVVVFDSKGNITGTKGTILETYPLVSKNKLGKDDNAQGNYWVDVVNNASAYVRIKDGFVGADDIVVELDTDLEWGDAVIADLGQTFGVMNKGASFNFQGAKEGMPADGDIMDAYTLFADSEAVDISLMLTGNHETVVKKYVMGIAITRKDCVVFVSPSYDVAVVQQDNQKIVEYFNGDGTADDPGFISTSYAVFDSGFKYQYDRYNNNYFWSPLSSDIAGLCARTDSTNAPWFSPAGLNRGQIKNVVKLSTSPVKVERDELYKNRINPVVTFVGQGTVLFGDKTAQSKPSAFDRINVRRLFIVLEKAIATASKFLLFEFNDIYTRSGFVSTVVPFLRNVQSQRGVEDFKVICDLSNNTPQVINSNSFVGDIYIKPNRSINFITLNFTAVASGVDFSEVVNPTGN